MEKLISYLSKNKRRIAKGLYLAAALIEQLPDPDSPKFITHPLTIADQLKPKRHGHKKTKRPARRRSAV